MPTCLQAQAGAKAASEGVKREQAPASLLDHPPFWVASFPLFSLRLSSPPTALLPHRHKKQPQQPSGMGPVTMQVGGSPHRGLGAGDGATPQRTSPGPCRWEPFDATLEGDVKKELPLSDSGGL